MRNYKPEVQLNKVSKNPYSVTGIANLTVEAAIAAITEDYDVFAHLPDDMKNNEEVRLAVCDIFGLGILQFRKTATDEMWHRAVMQNPSVIRFIEAPAEDTVWQVLMTEPSLIEHVKNATEEMKSAAAIMQ